MAKVLIHESKIKKLADIARKCHNSTEKLSIDQLTEELNNSLSIYQSSIDYDGLNRYAYFNIHYPNAKLENNRCSLLTMVEQSDYTDSSKQVGLTNLVLNYNPYISVESNQIIVLKSFNAIILGNVINYKSTSNSSTGKFTINSNDYSYTSSSGLKGYGFRIYNGPLETGDIIKFYTTSSSGWPHQYGSIWIQSE